MGQILYLVLKEHPRTKDVVLGGLPEHNVVEKVRSESTDLSPGVESCGATATVVGENVEHHVEEEETSMFVKPRQIFDRSEREALGKQRAAYKIMSRASGRSLAAQRER